MKRSPLLRKSPLRAKTGLRRTSGLKRTPLARGPMSLKRTPLARNATPLVHRAPLEMRTVALRTKPLRRTRMKWKPRRRRAGDDKRYLAWVRTHPCCVGGLRCKRAVAHHAIEMGGQDLAGMGSTAPDSETLPLCCRHHREFHLRQGFCKGWSDLRRRVFQQDEITRLRAIWFDLENLGVVQEPERQAI